MNLFRRKAPVEFAPVTLADEAMSAVGFQDAMRAQALAELRDLRARLASNIAAETKALAIVDEQIAREERASVGMALAIADAEIGEAVSQIEADAYDPADDGRKSYEAAVEAKRKRGDRHWPKRASESLEAAE